DTIPSNSDTIQFYIACKHDQESVEWLEKLFWKKSDPLNSEEYQQWLSYNEVQRLVKPKKHSHDKILKWLLKFIPQNHIIDYKDSFKIKTEVHYAVKLFESKTKFSYYRLKQRPGIKIIRLDGDCHVKESIFEHIDMITGLDEFPRDIPIRVVPTAGLSTQLDIVVPQFITKYYHIPNVTCQGLPKPVSQAVIEFLGEFYLETDLQLYCNLTSTPYKALKPEHIIGSNNFTNFTLDFFETALDMDIMIGLNPLADLWYFNTDPYDNRWLYIFTMIANHMKVLPEVMSISYGNPENTNCVGEVDCDSFNQSSHLEEIFIKRVNIEFMKLGLRGVSIVVSSGDDGVYGYNNTDCKSTTFIPQYPASSPYVTTLGATYLKNQQYQQLQNAPPICINNPLGRCVSGGDEVAVSYENDHFTSGGGFSNLQSMPSYQKHVVEEYLYEQKCQLPSSSMFNRTGRAYPDLSALGNFALVVANGSLGLVGGTSMSSPLFGACVSILNSYSKQLTNGRTLGFLNPLLYLMYEKESTKIFKDITEGNNRCTTQTCTADCKGFYASEGWDPVTGLGTPNIREMLKFIKALNSTRIDNEKY
ncbi:unnamed protein product, partial [Didymodactylos carnosus]